MEWQQIAFFCGILALWSGFIIATLKWMLDKSDRHMGERLDAFSKHLDGYRDDVHAVELELERFKREVAINFVPRTDWIQFGIGLEGKLDRVIRRLDDVPHR